MFDGEHASSGVADCLHGIPLLATPFFCHLFILDIDVFRSLSAVFVRYDALHWGLRPVLSSESHLVAYDGLKVRTSYFCLSFLRKELSKPESTLTLVNEIRGVEAIYLFIFLKSVAGRRPRLWV